MKAVKINNGAYLPVLSMRIEEFCKRAPVDGIQPGNMQTYLAQVAQFGGDRCELWVVIDDDKPVAFASWEVNGLPHIAKVYWLAVHSWHGDGEPVQLLTEEFIKFGHKHNAVWWSGDSVGEANARLFTREMEARGFKGSRSKLINMVFRKV